MYLTILNWSVVFRPTPLKNDGVKVSGVGMTSLFYEMENNPAMFQSPPTRCDQLHVISMGPFTIIHQHKTSSFPQLDPSLLRSLGTLVAES